MVRDVFERPPPREVGQAKTVFVELSSEFTTEALSLKLSLKIYRVMGVVLKLRTKACLKQEDQKEQRWHVNYGGDGQDP